MLKINHSKAIHEGQDVKGTILVSNINWTASIYKTEFEGGKKGNTRKYQLNDFII